MEVSGEEEEAREAHMREGTLERGGMRIYLVSHLARGPRRLRILTLAPRRLAGWLIGTRCGKEGWTVKIYWPPALFSN